MQTRFNQTKAAHAAAVFLRLRGQKMNYLKLIKLMYLLDRTALARWERPVTGDRYVSMKLGPVLSNVRDLIVWEQPGNEPDLWHQLIEKVGAYDVELKQPVEPDSLSRRELDLINEIFSQFGHMDRWKLAEYTHSLPEWKKPESDNSSSPLAYEDVLQGIGKTPEEAAEICREIMDVNLVAGLVGCK